MKRVALYIRVSSDKQAKSGDSLREQEDTLNEYVKSQKDIIIHSTYIDDGISGQKLDRDEFQRLMTDVKDNQIDIILFTKLDRWFRSLKHYLNNQDILQKYETHWLAVSQPFYDTTTPYGRTFINQVMSFAELEAQMTSERMIAIFDHKIKVGEVVSGSTPFGYSIENKRLVPNDDAEIVLSAFQFQADNVNLAKTSRFLLSNYGIQRTDTGLRRMFRNKKYIGINRDNHEFCQPIIPTDLFELVNKQLDYQRGQRKDIKYTYLFTGLVFCAHCQRALNSGQKGSSRRLADGTLRRYKRSSRYSCRQAYKSPKCINTKTVGEKTLEQYLIDNLHVIANQHIETLRAVKKNPKKDNTKQIIEKTNVKLERLKKLYLSEIISLDEYKNDRLELLAAIQNLNPVKEIDHAETIANLNNLLNPRLFENYNELDKIKKAIFWRKIIKRIEFDNNYNYTIEFN